MHLSIVLVVLLLLVGGGLSVLTLPVNQTAPGEMLDFIRAIINGGIFFLLLGTKRLGFHCEQLSQVI